jgi:aspartyl aminopeptidase
LIVSNDATHGLHPSYAGLYEPDYSPILGNGPVVKLNANLRYATTVDTHHAVRTAASEAGVALQLYAAKADQRAGSTVGPITWGRTGIPTVDLGVPIWAMHSIRETAGTADLGSMVQLLSALANRDA